MGLQRDEVVLGCCRYLAGGQTVALHVALDTTPVPAGGEARFGHVGSVGTWRGLGAGPAAEKII